MAEATSRQDRFAAISQRAKAGRSDTEQIRESGGDALAPKRADLGWLGRFFGSKEHAPTYIAALFGAVASVFIIFSSVFVPGNTSDVIRSYIGPVLIAVVGFLFGRGSKT
jgi:hypothetical protein